MPVPAAVAHAAAEFRYNNNFTTKFVNDLSHDEWFKRPEGACNHVAWIVGHMVWSRKAVLSRLGGEWTAPWLGLFARGEKLDETAAYPSPDTLMDAFKEVTAGLEAAMESATDESVAQPAPKPGPPSADGKISGTVSFMAWHETYHVGQISLIHSLLGKKSLMG